MRSRKSRTPSSSNTLPSESIGTLCMTLPKVSTGSAPTRTDGLSVADEMREARLDRCVALAQRVILGVGDLRLVLPVVERVVMGDLAGEALKLGGGLALGQAIDRRWRRRGVLPLLFALLMAVIWLMPISTSADRRRRGPRR